MGYNSVLFICNDCIGSIKDDPAGWWEKAWDRLMDVTWVNRQGWRGGVFGHGCNANGFQAVSNTHADNHVLIIAGGNYATVVDTVHVGVGGHHTEEQQIELLKRVLDKKGYRVSKKPVKKSTSTDVEYVGGGET